MKRIFIALAVVILNTFLFSCTSDTIAETDGLYNTHATEGDDSNPPPPPPGP